LESVLPDNASWLWVLSAAVLVAIVAGRLCRGWYRQRGARAITCPENRRPAGVTVDAWRAALSGFAGSPQLRLSSCSRWPEKAGCGQQCLAQIQSAPDGCLVRKVLTGWFAGKRCVFCGRQFGEIEWAGQKPALQGPDRVSLEFNQIPADKLYEILETASPVCFACHMANTLVRTRPDLATDRSRRPNQ
jgi:hypothetical protein